MRFDYDPDYPQEWDKHRPDQLANLATFDRIPDDGQGMSLTQIRVVPVNASTVTYVNPVDPGNPTDTDWYAGHAKFDRVLPAGILI